MQQTQIPAWAKGTLFEEIHNFKTEDLIEMTEPIHEGEEILDEMIEYEKILYSLHKKYLDMVEKDSDDLTFSQVCASDVLGYLLAMSLSDRFPGEPMHALRHGFKIVRMTENSPEVKQMTENLLLHMIDDGVFEK